MKRIDWKFCVVLTGVALAWLIANSAGSENNLVRMIPRLFDGLVDAIANAHTLRALSLLASLAICLMFFVALAYVVSRFWNSLIRRFSPKIIDLSMAEAYAAILIIPLLVGYIF